MSWHYWMELKSHASPMRTFFFSLFLCMHALSYAHIEEHFRKWEHTITESTVKNIDYIYLINLDTRPEKLTCSLKQLKPYDIIPERFSAIYGWTIPVSALNDIGLCYFPWMWRGKDQVLHFPPSWNGASQFISLHDDSYGITVFSGWTTPGAIGCTMSHLSVLHDAYKMGYETIWVMEDDIEVVRNPHTLADLIETLDHTVGKAGWDILYTDFDYLMGLDNDEDLCEQLPMKWRPDMPLFDLSPLLEHTPIGKDFFKIGCRNRTHSMIVRRSGIKKILDFYREHGMFLPIDHELSFIPAMQFYVLKDPVVTYLDPLITDTKNRYFP